MSCIIIEHELLHFHFSVVYEGHNLIGLHPIVCKVNDLNHKIRSDPDPISDSDQEA